MNQKRGRDNKDMYPHVDNQFSNETRLTGLNDMLKDGQDVGVGQVYRRLFEMDEAANERKLNMKRQEYLSATEFYTEERVEDKRDFDNEETGEESDSEDETETELDDDMADLNNFDVMEQPAKERRGRGPTRMESLWKDHDQDNKINLKFNRYGQPCGLKTCKLTSFIGTLVKGKEISLAAKNWSNVDKSAKEKLWITVQGFFNIDESFKRWVLRSASKKWKDFKVVLKRTYFNPNLSRRQNIRNGCGSRIPDPQWAWLVNHWKSREEQAKSEKNKAIRAMQLNGTHTTGSRSFSVTLDQLEIKEGRQVARAELYIVTHTKRNGEPVDM